MESQVRKDADALRVELIAQLRSAHLNEDRALGEMMYERVHQTAQTLNHVDGGHCAVLERSFGSFAAAEIEMPRPAIDEAKLHEIIHKVGGSYVSAATREVLVGDVMAAAKSGELWAK